MSVIAKNPILSGFYPDPSICRVGDDFYIVNSSFAYFPGLPIMHSRDLAHWEQIGNAMDRASQLPLKETGHSRGLFAPTMRYHEGTFYIICTNVSFGGNFIITAQNPAGPWSEPHYIKGADGIDPSLFFDEDGTCYYIGTHPNPKGCKYDGDWYIWIQELNIDTMELTGEAHNVWNGALKNVIWPEGPHLYRKDGYYYIMNAEGGTGPEHAVTICRSENIYGPYENNPCNPILTHRHLGKDYAVRYVGHGDLVETVNGEWYMVMLAVRPQEGYTLMGRETFLAKVVWENDWPVVNPGVGKLTDTVEIDLPEEKNKSALNEYVLTTLEHFGPEFVWLRNPSMENYKLVKGEGLKLGFTKDTLKDKMSPSYVAVRQKDHKFTCKTMFLIDNLTQGRIAGLAYVQDNGNHFRIEVSKEQAQIILCVQGNDTCVRSVPLEESNKVYLSLKVRGLSAMVAVGNDYMKPIDIRALSSEEAGGFTGCTVGMYASAQEYTAGESACFKLFSYTAD